MNSKGEFLKFRTLHIQKRNYNYYLSLNFILFICLKNKKKIFLYYNRCKLLTFTKKIKEHLSTRSRAYLKASVYIYIYIYLYYIFGCHSLDSRVLKRDKYPLISCEMDWVHFILQIIYYKFRDEILSHDSKF